MRFTFICIINFIHTKQDMNLFEKYQLQIKRLVDNVVFQKKILYFKIKYFIKILTHPISLKAKAKYHKVNILNSLITCT